MQTLDLALKRFQGGRKITIPFRQVDDKVDFRTGDLAVLAGAPGGGKSLTALNWAWRSPDPMLYLAQDSPRSVLRRLTALALNRRVGEIIEDEHEYWAEQVANLHQREELILEVGAQSVDEIEQKIVALHEWLQEPPSVVFIDNLIDMKVEGTNHSENNFYAKVLPDLKQLAIKLDVGIVFLHHVIRGGERGKKVGEGLAPLKLTDLLFAGEREVRHAWGVYRSPYDRDELNFQILKQQDGETGIEIKLDWDRERGRLWSR